MTNNNLFTQNYSIGLADRMARNNHKPLVLWLTGLSGSGKSTLANASQNLLFQKGYQVVVLDGDNVRQGLNKDLGFSDNDRMENIRRVSELAKLFCDFGHVVITAFISPFESDRALAKSIIGPDKFAEIYINADLQVCENRDVKGLYKKARKGEIPNFTGIDSPYEAPISPDLLINSGTSSLSTCTQHIFEFIESACKIEA